MRRVVGTVVWVAAAVLAATLVALLPPGRLNALAAGVAEWEAWLAVGRLAAIGGVWLWWDRLAGWAAGSAAAVGYLRARRHFYAGCLVAVELVIVQNSAVGLWDLLA